MPDKPDVAELAQLLAQGRFQYLQLAQCLLDADVIVSGWSAEAVARAIALKEHQWTIGLEIHSIESGAAIVMLIATSPTGARCTLGIVPELTPGATN